VTQEGSPLRQGKLGSAAPSMNEAGVQGPPGQDPPGQGDGSGRPRQQQHVSGTRKQKRPRPSHCRPGNRIAPAAEKADLDKKAEAAAAKGQARPLRKAIEAAEIARCGTRRNLEPLAPEAMPPVVWREGRMATPQNKTQRELHDADRPYLEVR